MIDLLIISLSGGTLLALGFIGCLVPVLPGPLLGYAALWVPVLFGMQVPGSELGLGAAIVVVVIAVDYVLPTFFARKFRCSKVGMLGCFLGTLVGLLFLPWGIVLGPVLGTMSGELLAGKSMTDAARGGLGAFLGFTVCVVMKLVSVGIFAWWFAEIVWG